ncbi:MAG: (Fe-S)-binding protein [SAR324 cluster bacterium]|nr:(Fe-S)-binding protein [SAR324 cluster bacterium]
MSKYAPDPKDMAAEMGADYLTKDLKGKQENWMETVPQFKDGNWCYAPAPEVVESLGLPHGRKWSPIDDDWDLPENFKEIVHEGIKERLGKNRAFKLFMDTCVRCGACADKCHFFLGTGDAKNMPVMRAELMRSVYRGDFTLAGKIMKKMVGGRELTPDVIKEWYSYFYQCTECRRCSVFCPYGIDTAEITMMAREILNLIGVNLNWILKPASDCNRTGNHLGIEPHTFVQVVESLCDDIEDITGITIEPSFNRKGAEVLFITPSGDAFAEPGIYTMMGYMLLFEHIGLDYTFSTYASEGGNFGLFTGNEVMKKLNAKMYHEAERLGVKFIIGGECGHMWRVVHQYMDTMNGPAPFLDVPVSPITGTVFENAKSTKMVHIAEFTADLIKHGKLNLDPSRNDHFNVTFHDSCNTARGMGMLEEPRYILNNVLNNFHEMPEKTIKELTFCCGSGSGLNTEEYMDVRMRGGFARASAVEHVAKKHGVNTLTAVCAIDRVTLTAAMKYWVPGVQVSGLHELVGNALIMEGEKERDEDLREEPLAGVEDDE